MFTIVFCPHLFGHQTRWEWEGGSKKRRQMGKLGANLHLRLFSVYDQEPIWKGKGNLMGPEHLKSWSQRALICCWQGLQARSKDLEILEEKGGAGPSTMPRRDHEYGGGAGLSKLDVFCFELSKLFVNSGATDIVLVTLSSTAVERAIAQCTSRWAMARGHRLNTSIVLAAVHGLSGLFRAVSAVEPFTLSSPSHSVPVPNRPSRLRGR